MTQAPNGKAAGPVGTGTTANQSARAKDITNGGGVKPGITASQAACAAEMVLAGQMEFGLVGPLDLPPEVFAPVGLLDIASAVRGALDEGCRGFAEVMACAVTATQEQAVADHLRVTITTISQSIIAELHRPEMLAAQAEIVRAFATTQAARRAAKDYAEHGGDPAALAEVLAGMAKPDHSGIADLLESRTFRHADHPEKPEARFKLAGMPLCTAGNISNIQAPPKAGKTGVMESMLASTFNGNRIGVDTLGFESENPDGLALIHLDTEQSRYDHDQLVRRALRRAHLLEPPPWLMSYSLTDLDITQRREALRFVMSESANQCGGIFAVMIDGIGDLCADPNDPEEAFALVHELHQLAITYDCTITTVLHENPGSEGGKTRGHLGSQLERKAETNLRLAKDADGITTVWAEKARHCYLPRSAGPCFCWNDAEGMHTSCGTSGEIKEAARMGKAQAEAEKAFDGEAMTYTELTSAIMEAHELKDRAATGRIKRWFSDGIITKDKVGKYRLSKP